VERAYDAVRRVVEPLGRDRVLSGDIIALADAIAAGAFTGPGGQRS